MKSIHDRPWYKKVHKKDSKNFRILIGHGRKQPKYAKKGGPFKLNPPKRRRASKLSAPMGVGSLEEETEKVKNTQAFLYGIQIAKQGDILNFYVKSRQNLNPGSFCPGDQQYSAKFVSNDEVEVQASFVLVGNNCSDPSKTKIKTKSKAEVLATFNSTIGDKDICNVLDCERSTWNGEKLNVALNKLKLAMAGPAAEEPPQKQKSSAAQGPKKKIKTKIAKRAGPAVTIDAVAAEVGGGISGIILDPNVKNSKPLIKSTTTMALKKQGVYGKEALAFSEAYAEGMAKALSKIDDPNSKKAAALAMAINGTIFTNVVDVYGKSIPEEWKDEIKLASGMMGKSYDKIIEAWKKVEKIIKAKDPAKELEKTIKKKAVDIARDIKDEISALVYTKEAIYWKSAVFKNGKIRESNPKAWKAIAKFWEEGTGAGRGTINVTLNGIKYGFLYAIGGSQLEKQWGNKYIPKRYFTEENIKKFFEFYQRKYGSNSLPLTLEQYKTKYLNAKKIHGDTWWSAAFINYIMRNDTDFQKMVRRRGRGSHRSYWVPAKRNTEKLLEDEKVGGVTWIYMTDDQAKQIGWSDGEGIGKIGDIVMVPSVGYKKNKEKIHGDIKTSEGRIGGNVRNSVRVSSRRKGVAVVTKSVTAKKLFLEKFGTARHV